ncbi:MAG: HAD-IIA family hydrolase [Alkalilacustris sp.]
MSGSWDRIDHRLEGASGIIFDLDGTLISGDRPLPGAVALLNALRRPFVIASNNSTDTAETLATRLRWLGFAVGPERLLLAGEVALEEVTRRFPGADVLLLASPALRQRARALGIPTVARGGDLVLVCRDTSFDYASLTIAAASLRRGAALMAANPDLHHPGPGGAPIPETGSLLAAIMAAAGRREAEIIGKPQPLILRRALERLGVSAACALLVGDNPETDGAGARRLGIRFLQVGPTAPAAGPRLRTAGMGAGPGP